MDTSSASHRQSRGIRAGALAQNSSQGWPAFVFYDLGSIVQGRQSQQLKMMLLPCVAFVLAVVSVDGRIGVALNTTNTSADLQFVCLQGQPVCTIHLPTKDQCQQLCASPEPRPPLMVCAREAQDSASASLTLTRTASLQTAAVCLGCRHRQAVDRCDEVGTVENREATTHTSEATTQLLLAPFDFCDPGAMNTEYCNEYRTTRSPGQGGGQATNTRRNNKYHHYWRGCVVASWAGCVGQTTGCVTKSWAETWEMDDRDR
jgi:hypothetical protein